MECNKDEAIRAKEISERKMMEKDIAGAKKFAMKAQNLYPGLDGLPQLLATIDVYIAFERKINGEVDWYGVLGADPLASNDTIRKQYRKLALVLHPDKNKLEVADGAFKILSEAWSLLSDKAKRTAYDFKRNLQGVKLKVPGGCWPAPATGNNGGCGFTSCNNISRKRSAPQTGGSSGHCSAGSNKISSKQSAPQTGDSGGRGFTSCNNISRKRSAPQNCGSTGHGSASGNNISRKQSAPQTGDSGGRGSTGNNNTTRNWSAPQNVKNGDHGFTNSNNTTRNQLTPQTSKNDGHSSTNSYGTTKHQPAPPTDNNGGHKCTSSNDINRKQSAPVSDSGSYKFTSNDSATMNQSTPTSYNDVHKANGHKHTAKPKPARPPPSSLNPKTFWTLCSLCKMQYEYLRTYLNLTLLCANCHQPFLACEIPTPSAYTHGTYTPWTTYQQQLSSDQCRSQHTTKEKTFSSVGDPASAPNEEPACSSGFASFNHVNNASGSYAKSDSASNPATSCVQSMHVIQPTCEKLEREHKEAEATSLKESAFPRKTSVSEKSGGLATGASNIGSSSIFKGESPPKRRRIDEFSLKDSGSQVTNQMKIGNGGVGMGNLPSFQYCHSELGRRNASRSIRAFIRTEASQLRIQATLMEKARREIVKKLSEWSSASGANALVKEEKKKEREKPKVAVSGRHSEYAGTIDRVLPKAPLAALPTDSGECKTEPMTISVPDPDIHDFDKDHTELSFSENQVWAAYDDDDGMPRYYAMIHNVISLNPFKLRVSWLNAKRNTELAPLNWVGSGFSKTSGEFWIGRPIDNDTLNSFSHKVKWTKGVRGRIKIYPRKGDVWALYKNWSPDWDELTPDNVIHKYEMVEVIKDYNEDQGVAIVPLVKVSGFRTVYHQNLDPSEIRTIPKEELFRFSHQVPSYLITGQEAENAPKGCLELDPAATPVELLQVITDFEEKEMTLTS